MNPGKLDMVEKKMVRITDILEISELKWMGMGKFNSDGHCIYYHGQESNRRNAVALIINKRVQNAVLGCNFKNDRMVSVHFQGKPLQITVIQVYAAITMGFPCSLDGKDSACNAGDLGSVPELGRSLGEGNGNGNPLQYTCLENSRDRLWGHKESGMTEQLTHSPITKAREAKVDQSYENLEDLLELIPKYIFFKCFILHWGLGCKSRKSRDIWSNRQVWPYSKK